jgi:hypothetical protein
MDTQENTPLKWPDGFGRTLIESRHNQKAWKKQWSVYVKGVAEELRKFDAGAVTITRNAPSDERFDPGVAVWFSLKRSEDFSWQRGLGIDNPKPSLEEIDRAFKRLAAKHHPDAVYGGSGGDVKLYMQYDEWRKQAKAWVRGESAFDLANCLPCDLYVEARQNLAAIKLTLAHLRALDRLGNPFMVERIMERSFRASLPAQASASREVGYVEPVTA